MTTHHYLGLPGKLTARLSTQAPLDELARRELAAHLPGLSFLTLEPETVDLDFQTMASEIPGLAVEGNRVRLYAPASASAMEDLHHLLWGVVLRALIDRDLYAVHAACVGVDNYYVLLVGHTGAGKTSLARRLIEHGFKLFSGNKTVIRLDATKPRAVAGTRIMTTLTRSPDGIYRRHHLHLTEAELSSEGEVKISAIFLVRINDGVQEDQPLSDLSALHTLYPYFLDSVNADVIVNGTTVVDGAPPQHLKQRLVMRLGSALTCVPVRRIAGSLTFLAQTVVKR